MHALVEPHFESAALLTIDVQTDTLDGAPLEIPGTSAAVPKIAALCEAFRASELPIVHVVRIYRADGSNAEPVRKDLVAGKVPILRVGTPGRALAPGVAPDPTTQLDDELLLSGRAQRLGGPVEEIHPGDVVWFPPGEKHWHGAAPTMAMTHIAIQEQLDGKVVEWLEKVSDEEYGG